MSAALDVRGLDDAGLAELFAAATSAGDDETAAAVLAECERQDDAAAAGRRRQAWRASPAGQRYAAADAAWVDCSHAEFLAAEAACRGRLLAAGAPARDPWPMLWTCSERDLDRWSSEEFKRWREFDAATFTRKADYMRQASRPRAGERPWDEREEPAVEAAAAAPAAVAPVGDEVLDERAAIDARRAERAAGRQARRERLAALAVPATAVAVPAAGQVVPAGLAPRRAEVDGARLLEQIGLFIIDHVALPSPAAAVALTTVGRP